MTVLRLTMDDVRRAHMCSRGVRAWLAQQGLSVDTFLSEGYPIETIEAIDCVLAAQLCAAARLHHRIPK